MLAKKKRSWIAASLVFPLFAILAACGGNGNNGSNGGTKDANSTASVAPSPAATASAAASTEPAEPKPDLKFLMPWMNGDYATYPVAKVLEKNTGYKVTYDMLPQNDFTDKLNLIVSSSEDYDLINATAQKDAFYRYAGSGALTDLTGLIDEFGPNIKKAISPESFDAVKLDGKIYGIPTKGVNYVQRGLLIRQDWVDKLGLNMPTTTDEFTALLQAFKDKDPGQNGDKNIPLTITSDDALLPNIIGAFGLPSTWNKVDGKLVPVALDPRLKDYANYMQSLYKQGLLDTEFPVNKAETAKEKFTSGRAGVLASNWSDIPSLLDALAKNKPDAKTVFVPLLAGPSGEKGYLLLSSFGYTFIPKASKHPEDTIKWVNAELEENAFREAYIGIEGEHYTVKDGDYWPILPKFFDERNLANNFAIGVDESKFFDYWQARLHKDERLTAAFDQLNNQVPDELKFPDPTVAAPYLPQYSKNQQQLKKVLSDNLVTYIAGDESESALQALVDEYNAAGGEEVAKEVNDWAASANK